MKEVKLTQGMVALVDDNDYQKINKYKWYAQRTGSNKYYATSSKVGLLHRFLLNPGRQTVDHINGDSLDNQRENLRICSFGDNLKNKRIYKNNTSGFKGVYLDKSTNTWKAHLTVLGKKKTLGRFKTKEQAYEAYLKGATYYFGQFASK